MTPLLRRTQSFPPFHFPQYIAIRPESSTTGLFLEIVSARPSEPKKKLKLDPARLTFKTGKGPKNETTSRNILRLGYHLGGDEIITLMRAMGLPIFSVNELRGIDDRPDKLAYAQNLVQNYTTKKKNYEEGLLVEKDNEIYVSIFKTELINNLLTSKLATIEKLSQNDQIDLAKQLLEYTEFDQFIDTHLEMLTQNKSKSNQEIKLKILNRINVTGETVRPFVIVSERNTINIEDREEAISKAIRLEFGFMNSCKKSLTPRTFFIISNNSNHWLMTRCAITPMAENQMNLCLTTVDSLGQANRTFSLEDKKQFFTTIALPDSYKLVQGDYIETAQQTRDEGELSTCGIRASFNAGLISGLLDQNVEADRLWEIAPNEQVLRNVASQIVKNPSKNLKALMQGNYINNLTSSQSSMESSSDESNFYKEKDLRILNKMLLLLEEYEKEGLDVISVLKRITSLCGGSSGITYKDDNPKCVRNRYGRDKAIDPKGFINFAMMHRAFIILEAGIPAPENVNDDFQKLKTKIAYILAKENNQETPPSTEGDVEDLTVIYQYVKANYYDVSIPRIAEELDSLFGLTIKTKEDLYFFGRKLIIIGELCHEIEKDIRSIQDDEANSSKLKEIIEVFKAINKERNNFVHPGALIKQFLELDQDNKLKSKLYGVIIKGLKLIHSPETKEILKTALSTREISEKGVKQKRKVKKEKTLTSVEKKLKKSGEYTRLLDSCRIIENSSLSKKEQQSIKFGETPEIDKLINIGNKLNIFSHVNALKTARIKLEHEFNMRDAEYRKCFNAAIGNHSFDITSFEDCERILRNIATLSHKIDWKIKDEFSKFFKISRLLSKLINIFKIYDNSKIDSFDEFEKLCTDQKGPTFESQKKSFNQLKNITSTHEQMMKNPKCKDYQKIVSAVTQRIEGFNIRMKNHISNALNTLATEQKEEFWQAKEKSHARLVQVLASSCSTHVIKDPHILEFRIKEELKDERTRLIQKIDEEINFAIEVNHQLLMDPSKKRAIREYVVTIVGQHMRDLGEIGALEHTLRSQTAREAGFTMRTLRSKGLAHEILRFDSDQFEETFREIILPATSDFNAIHVLQSANNIGCSGMRMQLGKAYERLHFHKEATDQFRQVIDYIENKPEAFREEFPNQMTDEEFSFRASVCLVIATSHFVDVCNGQSNFKASLEAINKVLKHLDVLMALNDSTLNNYIGTLHMRRGECLYYADARNLKEVVSAYSRAFDTASDPTLKSQIGLAVADRVCKSMRDSKSFDIEIINNLETCVNKIQSTNNISYYSKYLALEIILQFNFLKKEEITFNQTYKKLKNFLLDHKNELKHELGDKSHLLVFDAIRIKIYKNEETNDSSKLEEIYKEFKFEYDKIKKLNLHNDVKMTCCAYQLSELILTLVKKNMIHIAPNKLFELLEKSRQCLGWAKISQSEADIKKTAYCLARVYLKLRKNGGVFKNSALKLGIEYGLDFTEIKKMIRAEKNFQIALQSQDTDSSISYYTQAIKCLKSLEYIDEENQKNLILCKQNRSDLINAQILLVILKTFNSKVRPNKGKILIQFSQKNYSFKNIMRFSTHFKISCKSKIEGDFIRVLLSISDVERLKFLALTRPREALPT